MTLSDSSNSRRFLLAVFVLALPALLLPAHGFCPVDTPSVHDRFGGCPACEPRLPLDLELRPAAGDPSLPGTPLDLVITAKVDLPSVRVELLLPDQARLLSGPRKIEGTLARGHSSVLSLRVECGGPVTIRAQAAAVTENGLSFQRGVSLELGNDGAPLPPASSGRLVRSPGGRIVREFPAGGPAGLEVGP